jgi:hypothetical protein
MLRARSALLMAALLVLPAARSHLFAQTPEVQGNTLEGVWRIVEVTYTEPSYPTSTNPEPSLIIYTKRHYSFIAIRPRPKLEPPANPGKLTDAEKIARYEHWFRMTAHAGTYEYKDGVVTTRAIAAKNEAVMRGEESFEVKHEGGLLWLISGPNGYTLKLKRVE